MDEKWRKWDKEYKIKKINERKTVEEAVRAAIDVYDADKTGLHDFALESAGDFLKNWQFYLQFAFSFFIL